jgi:phosphate transport system permease protein
MWDQIWYESYPEPSYTWQSSSASNDFEPKFSLMPLAFGTLKAAFYAMLFAMPLAIMGAIYTAYFMSAKMRGYVKPTIEIMEALPTVILGFLAGLWLAPIIENHLPGVFGMLLIMPAGVLVFAFAWHKLPKQIRHKIPDGWQAALLIPVLLITGWIAMSLSLPMEHFFFGGDIKIWLSENLGLDYDQRNSLVVGIAMGIAVIPTIFSITEDAIFSVPKNLTFGSLALGATPWQTLIYVVILTASPGIFSAVMIGMGRAVGETMIVLMSTGNTPVMDMSVFQGMRTLAANVAVEMPESEVDSTHYRILFLAAMVLFIFTFMFNTLAEIVRQRLRKKYSSL